MSTTAAPPVLRPSPAASPVMAWYWPLAMAAAVAGFQFAPHQWTGTALAAGTGLLGIPELAMLVTRRYANTLSWWFWRTLRVVKNDPPSRWTATHYFAAGGYVVIAGDVLRWMGAHHAGYTATASAAVFAVWLVPHLFVAWWRG